MLGIRGSGDKKQATKAEAKKVKDRKIIIRLSILAFVILIVALFFSLGFLKSVYADYSKSKLQEFVTVWGPIEHTNEQTVEADLNNLNAETIRIKQEVEARPAPINARKLKSDVSEFFDYANTFTSEMHKDFQWSKELSIISSENEAAIRTIDLSNGTKSLQTAIAKIDASVTKMDAMVVSGQVAEAHQRFRDSIAEESAIYKKLLGAIATRDSETLHVVKDEAMVFNEKFDGMSGPSSALTIAYMIKTKEFEIKIEHLGKENDNASKILTNNFY